MTAPPDPTIEVSELSWHVDGRSILNDINLQLSQNETLGIVGPNGSGKSSLLRCIHGEQRPTSGHITINGRPTNKLSRRELARTLGVMFQNQSVDPGISAAQVIELGRLPHRRLLQQSTPTERDLLARCARRAGVVDLLNAPFARLSGGEQQRVVLARLLAQQPMILLLDEPTNHLDLQYQVELATLLEDLGLPTIVVLHDLTLAARMCDRLVVLDAGQVHASGPPSDVLTHDLLRSVWHVEADIIHDTHGTPIVVPHSTEPNNPGSIGSIATQVVEPVRETEPPLDEVFLSQISEMISRPGNGRAVEG